MLSIIFIVNSTFCSKQSPLFTPLQCVLRCTFKKIKRSQTGESTQECIELFNTLDQFSWILFTLLLQFQWRTRLYYKQNFSFLFMISLIFNITSCDLINALLLFHMVYNLCNCGMIAKKARNLSSWCNLIPPSSTLVHENIWLHRPSVG